MKAFFKKLVGKDKKDGDAAATASNFKTEEHKDNMAAAAS